MEEIITLTISGDGTVETNTTGFVGKTCEKEVGKLLVALNGSVIEEKKHDEYWAEGDNPVSILNL